MKNALILFFTLISMAAFAQERVNPAVKNFGGIYPISKATVLPDPNLTYKIVIDVKAGGNAREVNDGLFNIARMMNLHVQGGVKPENMEVVAVIHGGTTKALLKDDVYKKKYKVSNPNTAMINELAEAGVKFMVCGQSLIARDFAFQELNEHVELSISALTAITTYQLNGFALLIFQ